MKRKKKVMEAFRIENESGISYDIENISCKTYRIEASACYAVLDSDIITCYPNGILIRVNQRLSVIWKYIRERNIEKEGVEKEALVRNAYSCITCPGSSGSSGECCTL